MVLEQLGIYTQRNECESADSFHSVNSKQITDLNVKCKTLKLLEDYNKGENLDNFWYE